MGKTHLENQIDFFKNQLEENKRLHSALLMALESKFKTFLRIKIQL